MSDSLVTYVREVHAGAVLTVRSALIEVREKSLRFTHEMTSDEGHDVVARTTLKAVHIDTEARKSCAFTEEIAARLAALLGAQGTSHP